jgi:rare lipoprotein A
MRTASVAALGLLFLASSVGGALADVPRAQIERTIDTWRQTGKASFYGGYFHGRRTSSGLRFDEWGRTAAHRHWPFGTHVLVTNPANQRSEVVTITDRGPYVRDRVIDLSHGTARRLGLEQQGVAIVWLEVLR